MKNMDLRQVGTVLGLPLYIDLDSVPNIEVKKQPLRMTERDRKFILVRTILERAFGMTKEKK